MEAAPVLELLRTEVEEAIEPLAQAFMVLGTEPPGSEPFTAAIEQASAHVESLRLGAEAGGLPGLEIACERFHDNLTALADAGPDQLSGLDDLLPLWPVFLMGYLMDPQSEEAVSELAGLMQGEFWPQPLDSHEVGLLTELLAVVPGDDEPMGNGEPARTTQATAEDVSLELADDVNMEVFAAFVEDAPEQAASFSALLHALRSTEDPADILDQSRRIAHTLKGAAAVAGVAGVMNLTHHLEDLLEYLGKKGGRPGGALMEVLSEAADCLEAMIDALTGMDVPPAQAKEVLQSVLDWANRMDRGELRNHEAISADATAVAKPVERGEPATHDEQPVRERAATWDGSSASEEPRSVGEQSVTAEAAPEPDDEATASVSPEPSAKAGLAAKDEPAAAGPAAGADSAAQSLRVPLQTFDTLFRFAGELSVTAAQLDERINRISRMQQAFLDQDKLIQQRLFELEDLIDIRDVASAGYRVKEQQGSLISNEGDEGFDPLEMDEYNELHGMSRMLAESIADLRELNNSMHEEFQRLRGIANQESRLHRALEDTVLATRLVPVRSVASRLQRGVRQACRATGKEAELVIAGEDLSLDTELLQNLVDPLGHLLRNAVDHGIETAEVRAAAGKPAAGTIRLGFRRVGSMIEVLCQDDGCGLDLQAVHRRAVERGLFPEHARPTPEALARVILLPGFSTRDTVTHISGRGVGLDVVHDRVRAMQGTVDVLTETGAGSSFVIHVPAALVTVHVLLLEVAGQTVAMPSSDVLQVPAPDSGQLQREGDSPVYRLDGTSFKMRSLAEIMGRQATPAGEAGEKQAMLLTRVEGEPLALEVDRLLGGAEVVIKGFGENLPRVRGVLGAAILADGTPAPVLDISGLLREPVARTDASGAVRMEAASTLELAEVLVVDDSLSVRRSLSQFLQDSGFRVRLARDGIEAVRAVEERAPDLLLVDMEMPRMNGLELTAHLRQQESTRALPVIMLTSRSMQKHRQQAELAGVTAYLTKPFQETELMDCIEANLPSADVRTA